MSQGNEENGNAPIIYLYDEGILGKLLQYNAHASRVSYEIDGVEYETVTMNDNFEIIQEIDLGLEDYYD